MTAPSRIGVLLAVLACLAASAGAQARWPEGMASLRPGPARSPVPATLPEDLKFQAPGTDVPRSRVRFSGLWQGWACPEAACDVRVAVERLAEDDAAVVYATSGPEGSFTHRGQARFDGNELHLRLPAGSKLALRLRPDSVMEMAVWRADGQLQVTGVLTRVPEGGTR